MKLPQKKTVPIWTTSDGREFTDDHESRVHQAGLNLVWFLSSKILERDAENVLQAILEDPDGFREVIGPLLRLPKGKRAKSGLDFNEVEPLREGEQALGTEEPAPKRRGRPPGSKNKPKAVANGEEARTET